MRAPDPISANRAIYMAVLVVVFFAAGEWALAQTATRPPKEPPKFELSTGAVGIVEMPPLFWLEESPGTGGEKEKRWVPLEVPDGSRSAPVSIPLSSNRLFTGNPEAGENAKMLPYLEIPAKADQRLFLLFHLDGNGTPKHTFLDDADGKHPAGSVRVANLASRRAMVSAGGPPVSVPAGGQQVLQPVVREDGRFAFGHFVERPGSPPIESPIKFLRFPRADMRLLVVFAPMPVQPELDQDGRPLGPVTYAVEALRIYDRQPVIKNQEAKNQPSASFRSVAPPASHSQLYFSQGIPVPGEARPCEGFEIALCGGTNRPSPHLCKK